MKRAFPVALVLSFGACSDANDKALDELSTIADKLCTCQDMACADHVKAELDAVKAKHETSERDYPSGKQTQRAVKIALHWDECMEKVQRRSR